MSFGLEVRNELGTLNFTTEKLLTHKTGQFVPTTRSGSFTPPAGAGAVWACHGPFGYLIESGGMAVWVVGETIYWQMYFYKVSRRPVIQYGRYSA